MKLSNMRTSHRCCCRQRICSSGTFPIISNLNFSHRRQRPSWRTTGTTTTTTTTLTSTPTMTSTMKTTVTNRIALLLESKVEQQQKEGNRVHVTQIKSEKNLDMIFCYEEDSKMPSWQRWESRNVEDPQMNQLGRLDNVWVFEKIETDFMKTAQDYKKNKHCLKIARYHGKGLYIEH